MDKLDILKQTLSKVANREIDITIRGTNQFTFSFEGESKQSECNLIQFFGDKIEIPKNVLDNSESISISFGDKDLDKMLKVTF